MLNASHVRRLGLLVYASVEVATARMGSAHITYFRHIEALYSNCLRWHGNKPIRPVFHGSNSAEKNQVQVCYIRQLHSSVILPLGHTLIYPACPYYLCSINPPGLTGQTILPYWIYETSDFGLYKNETVQVRGNAATEGMCRAEEALHHAINEHGVGGRPYIRAKPAQKKHIIAEAKCVECKRKGAAGFISFCRVVKCQVSNPVRIPHTRSADNPLSMITTGKNKRRSRVQSM
ncbi:hypothetical protein GGP41_003364 [Bipolaris sorokiniana]|uniref:Uncharacterized protein n=2 Tax=Cochliobolus sativus TaxID=45130 RepID=A0A8H6DT71_COCSA|nr:uncharacterized protein COCSADRAFT_349930 [Bipolaris sorokiniana ND90Pr]EMD68418.1 hypothetical protein COCSADRAFT_349930 [Bipolaris sorokiniana ND90Pr]KAF5847142.1 hypothetical protein GGP41_003364 [Bipolaris sorokiniana]